jgi:MFS family permease
MVCEAFTAPLYAPLADRLGRRPVLLVCLLFWGVFAVCFGLVQSVWATIVMRGTREYDELSRISRHVSLPCRHVYLLRQGDFDFGSYHLSPVPYSLVHLLGLASVMPLYPAP